MPDDGAVPKDTVFKVLRLHGVSISQQADGPAGVMVLAKGGQLEAHKFPKIVRRRFIRVLARHFEVPIHHFYHPEMIPASGVIEHKGTAIQ